MQSSRRFILSSYILLLLILFFSLIVHPWIYLSLFLMYSFSFSPRNFRSICIFLNCIWIIISYIFPHFSYCYLILQTNLLFYDILTKIISFCQIRISYKNYYKLTFLTLKLAAAASRRSGPNRRRVRALDGNFYSRAREPFKTLKKLFTEL